MKENIMQKFFNERATIWDEVTKHNPEKIILLLKKIGISPQQKVLDVGTGTGILLPFLQELMNNSGEIIAVDFAEDMLKKAKEKYSYENTTFLLGDIKELNLDELSFDRIICYSVFPHFLEPERILKNIYRLLKNNGKIIICHSESKEVINNRHKEVGAEKISLGLPPVQELEKFLKKLGFKVLDAVDNADIYYIIGEK